MTEYRKSTTGQEVRSDSTSDQPNEPTGDCSYSYLDILQKEVPSGPAENATWRAQILDYCSRDHPDAIKFRGMVAERCRKDFWFWVMSFAFVH